MSVIDQAKAAAPIERLVELLGGEVRASARNTYDRWVPTRCPVHDDRNASAAINRRLGKLVCHACGFKGDVVDLAMAHLVTTDHAAAARWLLDRFSAAGSAPIPKARRWR